MADANNLNWSVSSKVSKVVVKYEIPLTEEEQLANKFREALNARGYPDRRSTSPKSPQQKINIYPNSRIYTVSVRDENGVIHHVRKEYIDINGDGHIDGWRQVN